MAALYPPVTVETDPVAEADLTTHAARTLNVHGIADTSHLITQENIATYAPAPDLTTLITKSPATTARNTIQPTADATPLTAKGFATQTAPLIVAKTSADVTKWSVDASGNVSQSGVISAGGNITAGAGGTQTDIGIYGPGSTSAIRFASDANAILYRSAAGTLRVTGILQVNSDFAGGVGGTGSLAANQGTPASKVEIGYNVGASAYGPAITFAGDGTAMLYRDQAGRVRVPQDLRVDSSIMLGNNSLNIVGTANAAPDPTIAMNNGVKFTQQFANRTVLVARGAASHTANLQEWQDGAGGVVASVAANGNTNISQGLTVGADVALGAFSHITWAGDGSAQLSRPGAGQIAASGGFAATTLATTIASTAVGINVSSGMGLSAPPSDNSAVTAFWGLQLNGQRSSSLGAVTGLGTGIGHVIATLVKPAVVGMVVRGAGSQTANLQEWQDSAGTANSKVKSDGTIDTQVIAVNSNIQGDSSQKLTVNAVTVQGFGQPVKIEPWTNAVIPLIVRGKATQSTNLQEWQDSASAVQFAISAAGIPQWALAANAQTTVGAAGGASALPATPVKYLKVKDSAGATFVVPAYNP